MHHFNLTSQYKNYFTQKKLPPYFSVHLFSKGGNAFDSLIWMKNSKKKKKQKTKNKKQKIKTKTKTKSDHQESRYLQGQNYSTFRY